MKICFHFLSAAGEDGIFKPVEARIEGERVIIETGDERPYQVRYAWQPFTRANLVNKDGLPASTFLCGNISVN